MSSVRRKVATKGPRGCSVYVILDRKVAASLARIRLEVFQRRTGELPGVIVARGSRKLVDELSLNRLIARRFLPCPGKPDDCVVKHRNGNRLDCRLENMFWHLPQSRDPAEIAARKERERAKALREHAAENFQQFCCDNGETALVRVTGLRFSAQFLIDADALWLVDLFEWKLADKRRAVMADAAEAQCETYLHRLIAKTFCPLLPGGAYGQVRHKNGKHVDCRAENLEWYLPPTYYGA